MPLSTLNQISITIAIQKNIRVVLMWDNHWSLKELYHAFFENKRQSSLKKLRRPVSQEDFVNLHGPRMPRSACLFPKPSLDRYFPMKFEPAWQERKIPESVFLKRDLGNRWVPNFFNCLLTLPNSPIFPNGLLPNSRRLPRLQSQAKLLRARGELARR